jgi:Ca-activated chloride channel family protein
MTARRLAAGLGAAVVLAAAPVLAQRFRVGIDIVSLNVTVTGADGRYVTDLGQDDFQVYEDGIQQTVSFFSHSQLPIALALLLDTSASMEEKLGTAQAAASGFAHRLRPDDVAEVIDFDSRVEILQPFTNDVKALEDAIHKTTAGGSTSLYNALYISLKELRKVQARAPDEIRRQAVVVLSDGEDTSSLIGYDEVLDLAKRSETGIYAIGLRSPRREQGEGFHEAEFVLRQLAQETGGRAFFPETVAELPAIYDQISEELASQYALGYTSSNPRRDGLWRRVVVKVSRADAQARTKQGYYAPAAARQ